jgi:DNA-binding IclR family transcriptional regulator
MSGETHIERVVRILEAFDRDVALSAPEVARRSDLPVSTAYRLVTELVR